VNWIFLVLIGGSVVVAAFNGTMKAVTDAGIEQAKAAVTLSISLIGQMALWLGLFGVLKEAGALRSISKAVMPVMKRLFPEVPPDHPAMSAMILNLSANMLGLANAATPFGLKAMTELNKLNSRPGVATNSMALFLAINNSGVAILALGVVAVRAIVGSRDPAGILVPTFLGACVHVTVAVLAAKFLQRRALFAAEKYPIDPTAATKEQDTAKLAEAEALAKEVPTTKSGFAIIALVSLAMTAALALHYVKRLGANEPVTLTADAGALWVPREVDRPMVPGVQLEALPAGTATLVEITESRVRVELDGDARAAGAQQVRLPRTTPFLVTRAVLSDWILPFLMLVIVTIGLARKARVYEAFIPAAKEGFQVGVMIIPFLVAILVGIGMFRASGAFDFLIRVLTPVVTPLGLPAEALPMALIRPLSGSAALGVMTDTMRKYGPDSFIGYLVSMLNGSSETTFYVLSVYFGAVGVKAIRHTMAACLITDAAGVIIATTMCHLFFG